MTRLSAFPYIWLTAASNTLKFRFPCSSNSKIEATFPAL